MRIPSALTIAVLVSSVPPSALACGACDEDKVAATYDHAIVSQAKASRRTVVFGTIEGSGNVAQAARRIVAASASIKGIRADSVRTSVSPAAFSFSLDTRVQSPAAAIADLQHRIGVAGVYLAYIQSMR